MVIRKLKKHMPAVAKSDNRSLVKILKHPDIHEVLSSAIDIEIDISHRKLNIQNFNSGNDLFTSVIIYTILDVGRRYHR